MFRRISNLFRGFFGLFVSGAEKRNPEALLENEKENLRTQIAQFNKSLITHAGHCEKLISQVKLGESSEQEIKAKAAANLRAGNQRLAGEAALELQQIRKNLETSRVQLTDAERTYRELVHSRDTSIQAARTKIESLRKDLDSLKMNQALAEMNEMASGLMTSIGGSGDTLDRLQRMVEEEKNKAAGRARVARDSIDSTSFQDKAAERDALGDIALADLAAELGMAVGNESAPPAVEMKKEMSPD
jgi:phage shock protein A